MSSALEVVLKTEGHEMLLVSSETFIY